MAGPGLRVDVLRSGATARVGLEGELDLATVEDLRAALRTCRGDEAVRHIVVDLRRLTYLDSSGLTVLYHLHAASRADGFAVSLVRGPRPVQRIFEMAGLDKVIAFVDRPGDATRDQTGSV